MQALAVDSSVLVAIIKGEVEAPALEEALADGSPFVGWPTVFETRIWLLRRGSGKAERWLNSWLELPSTRPLPFDGELERLAAAAYRRFGKGRHPAGLNFGDCMAYAVARQRDVPLLFKGGDFARTDVKVHQASVRGG